MNADGIRELESIKRDLNSIISELENISDEIRINFTGIGGGQCSDCIDRVRDQYRYVRRKLNELNTSEVTEAFARSYGGGGNGAFGGGGGGSR